MYRMEDKCEIELTEGYHSINSRDVRLHIHPDCDPGSSKPWDFKFIYKFWLKITGDLSRNEKTISRDKFIENGLAADRCQPRYFP